MTRLSLAPVALSLLALLTTGCPPPNEKGPGVQTPASKDALDQAKARGTLIVAIDPGYKPFESRTKSGELEGFDIDLLGEIAKDLGVKLKFKPAAWTGIIAELRTGKADLIMSGMSITEERQKAVDFSEAYYWIGQVILKRKGDERIKSYKDLNDPTFSIVTQHNTTGEAAIKSFMPKAKLHKLPKANEGVLEVLQKKADAMVFDHPFVIEQLRKYPDKLEGIMEHFTKEGIGVAIRKDSPKLRAAVNATFARLRKSGDMDKFVARWFPESPEAKKASPQ